jgi:hypothetical protein
MSMNVQEPGKWKNLRLPWILFFSAILYSGLAGAWEGDKRYEIYGYIESDLRLTLPVKDAGGLEDYNFIRSDNTFRLKGSLAIARNVKASADFKLILTGMMAGDTLEDLSYREKIDPFRVENDALYLQVVDFLLPGLDFRIGRQIVIWGTADKFNPTSNLNSLDLEDPLKFGEYVANEMIGISYSPPGLVAHGESPLEDMTFQFIVVPFFRPAQLPFWTGQAFTNPDLFKQRVHAGEMVDLIDTQQIYLDSGGGLEYDVKVNRPDFSIKNVQVGMKLEWTLWGVDMSVSYYRGFYDIPVAERVYAEDLHLNSWPGSTTPDLREIIMNSDVTGTKIVTHTLVGYPRMQVIGADFASSLDRLGGLGLWGEVAFYLHPPVYYHIRTSDTWGPGLGGTEVRILSSEDHLVEDIEGNWFFKLTAGIDYTIFSWWYVNIQYLHGFVDEFGMNDLGDYIVAGSDFKFFEDRLLFRLFGVIEICPPWNPNIPEGEGGHYSAMIYPELTLSFWRAVDISIGGLFGIGDKDTAYGSPLSGPSMVFMRGRVSI